jgi:superfamily I DNA and RNA helicase
VVLERAAQSYPEYFERLLTREDALSIHQFETDQAQAEWVASSIETNLKQDELEADDMLIVLPSAYTAKSEMTAIAGALARRGISSHLAGVTSSRDELFVANSIAMAHIFRSKGNEAPMVYVVNAHHGAFGVDLITRRNTLFTAITRSRAWVRICGVGPSMQIISQEVRAVQDRGFKLKFRVPTQPELAKMRQIHRELSEQEIVRAKKATDGLATFLAALRRGEVTIDSLPPELRTQLAIAAAEGSSDPDDEDAQ